MYIADFANLLIYGIHKIIQAIFLCWLDFMVFYIFLSIHILLFSKLAISSFNWTVETQISLVGKMSTPIFCLVQRSSDFGISYWTKEL